VIDGHHAEVGQHPASVCRPSAAWLGRAAWRKAERSRGTASQRKFWTSGRSGHLGVEFRRHVQIGSQTGGAFGSVLVTQIEVGPSHFAFLLDDGRVCRLPFSVISDRLDLSRTSNSLMGMAQSGGSGSGLGKSVSKVAHTSAASGEHPITPYFILGLYCKTFYVGH